MIKEKYFPIRMHSGPDYVLVSRCMLTHTTIQREKKQNLSNRTCTNIKIIYMEKNYVRSPRIVLYTNH
jgi:hypothetical protein